MSRSSNQKLKLLYLIDKFKRDTDENHGLTTRQLLEYLDSNGIKAERKSLYDDLETLREYGLDIEKEKRDKQVYYKLVSRDFEIAELKLLVDSVQAAKFLSEKQTNELIKKLENLASKYEAGDLQRQVYVVNRVKNSNKSVYLAVDEIHRAIYEDRQVSFVYTEWNLNKELVPKHAGKIYRISPWALSWDDENYYLIGYDEAEDKIKHFRVDKIKKLNKLEESRNGRDRFKKFDLAAYSKKMFGMYGGNEERVKLRLPNRLVGVILDRFGSDVMIIPENDGAHFTVNVDVQVSNQFIGWLLGLGPEVCVVGPDRVCNQVKELLKNALNNY